jgi:hypothetical protein
MGRPIIAKYVTPWKYRREQAEQQRLAALRQRDGDNCRRCRRTIRFDLPSGHDRAPLVESIISAANAEPEALEGLCLTHVRCNAAGEDHTGEVTERIRRRSEATLLSRSRKRA